MNIAIATLSTFLISIAVFVAALSRHKKSGTGNVKLIGVTGVVETKLDPAGTVIIDGELWRARSRSGTPVGPALKVTVVALDSHLLLVEGAPGN